MIDITTVEELRECLSDEDNVSARYLKHLRWYSSLLCGREGEWVVSKEAELHILKLQVENLEE